MKAIKVLGDIVLGTIGLIVSAGLNLLFLYWCVDIVLNNPWYYVIVVLNLLAVYGFIVALLSLMGKAFFKFFGFFLMVICMLYSAIIKQYDWTLLSFVLSLWGGYCLEEDNKADENLTKILS